MNPMISTPVSCDCIIKQTASYLSSYLASRKKGMVWYGMEVFSW